MLQSLGYCLGMLYGKIPKNQRPVIFALLIAGISSYVFYALNSSKVPANTPLEIQKISVVVSKQSPRQKEEVEAARNTMNVLMLNNEIYEEGFHLVVNMKNKVDDPELRLNYVKTIAGVDLVLHGQLRNIYFYGPTGKQIAQADKLNGIRLLE